MQLATETGIGATEAKEMLEINAFMDNVQADRYEAQQLGVRGGPFFIFDSKYAVSGAQDSTLFLQVLAKGWNEKMRKNCPLTGAFALRMAFVAK